VLHCLEIVKMCYSVRHRGRTPLHQKAMPLFMGPQR
jgi:hypothetical protein